MQDMAVGLKISTTIIFLMFKKVFMTLREVYLCLGLVLLYYIIQVVMVDHLNFICMVIIEVGIGITSENFLHITMVD